MDLLQRQRERFELAARLLSRSALWAIRSEGSLFAGWSAEGWEAAKPSIKGNGPNKVAVIPIEGVLTKDGPSWYGSNYDNIGAALEAATANPEVKHIVLAVDSPGGEVTGLPETAALVASAAKVKRVSAIVDGMSASAAYYLTSQANDVTVTPSGEVGSVGVRMMHMDVSKMLEDFGVKVTELYSGDFKTEWSPYKPLSDEAKADMQPRLNAVHADFINAVSAGRGERATQSIREARFGEGRMFSSSDAALNGMVDEVQASREFYKMILPPVEQQTSAPSLPSYIRTQADMNHDKDVADYQG